MYERAYGSKCQPGVYRDTAEIAKDIRADIKAAVKDGRLPGTVANYTVRTSKYSGGSSIDVSAVDLDGMWTKGTSWRYGHEEEVDVLTEQGQAVQDLLKEFHSAYNYDGSESQVDYFDVNYYGQASVISPWQQDYRNREKAKKAAAKAA